MSEDESWIVRCDGLDALVVLGDDFALGAFDTPRLGDGVRRSDNPFFAVLCGVSFCVDVPTLLEVAPTVPLPVMLLFLTLLNMLRLVWEKIGLMGVCGVTTAGCVLLVAIRFVTISDR